MKLFKLTAVALALVSTTAMANVETNEDGKQVITTTKTVKPFGVGLELSSLGYGANAAWGVNDTVELQGGWSGFNIKDIDVTIDGDIAGVDVKDILPEDYQNMNINLKGNIDSSNPYIGLQTRPFKNAFTVGTGIIVPDQSADFTMTAVGTSNELPLNGKKYALGEGDNISLTAENKHKLAPYLTVGLRPKITSRFGLSAEIGAAFMGDYAVKVDVKKGANSTTPDAVLNEIKTEIDNKIDNGENIWLPIIKLGATMRF